MALLDWAAAHSCGLSCQAATRAKAFSVLFGWDTWFYKKLKTKLQTPVHVCSWWVAQGLEAPGLPPPAIRGLGTNYLGQPGAAGSALLLFPGEARNMT